MKPTIKEELLDELLANYTQPDDLLGPDGLLTELKKRLINRVLESEMTTHLGYEKHASAPEGPSNSRNGHSDKTLRTDDGKLGIKVPRDRSGSFEPALVPKHQRHFDGLDDAIISLYSRGLSVREIQEHLLEIYKVEVSTALISNATEAVVESCKRARAAGIEVTELRVSHAFHSPVFHASLVAYSRTRSSAGLTSMWKKAWAGEPKWDALSVFSTTMPPSCTGFFVPSQR